MPAFLKGDVILETKTSQKGRENQTHKRKVLGKHIAYIIVVVFLRVISSYFSIEIYSFIGKL